MQIGNSGVSPPTSKRSKTSLVQKQCQSDEGPVVTVAPTLAPREVLTKRNGQHVFICDDYLVEACTDKEPNIDWNPQSLVKGSQFGVLLKASQRDNPAGSPNPLCFTSICLKHARPASARIFSLPWTDLAVGLPRAGKTCWFVGNRGFGNGRDSQGATSWIAQLPYCLRASKDKHHSRSL